MFDFLNPTEFVEMMLDFDEKTKKTIFKFRGYHGKELTSEREYRIKFLEEDIEKLIGGFEQIKEKLKE